MDAVKRFWSKVARGAPDACWLWTGARNTKGYGAFWWDGALAGAHRYSYTLANGPIPPGLFVMHTCDTPLCVNPAHLRAGTAAENTADMVAKGRGWRPVLRGEANGNAKLTAAQVSEIRARYALGRVTQKKLGRAYGISQTLVSFVVRGLCWRPAPAPRGWRWELIGPVREVGAVRPMHEAVSNVSHLVVPALGAVVATRH